MTTPSGPTPTGPEFGPHGYQPDAQPWDPAYPYPAAPQQPYGSPYPPASNYPYGYQPYGYPPYGHPPYGAYSPQPPAAPRAVKRRRAIVGAGVLAVAAATVVGVTLASGTTQTINGAAAGALGTSNGGSSSSGGSSNGGSSNGGSSNGGGSSTIPGSGTYPFPRNGTGSGSGNGSASTGSATSAQQRGVVDIVSVENYGSAEAAGTGMILDSSGTVLTNNHVIDGATSIRVTVVSTGKSYTAKVVGTAPTKDIAVIKLQNASGLTTANLGNSTTVSVGDSVTGVGNAGGTGGTPSAASGKVTALNKTITASDENGTDSETLHGVIVTDAPIQAGDSGGPLYNSDDKIIGIDTAASTSGRSVGFAIPINTALSVAGQIEKGVETSSIHIGYPGFLGITVDPATTAGGALVGGVLNSGPAAKAGIIGGDVITRVGNTAITGQAQLRKVVSSYKPGAQVSVTYVDPTTGSHTTTVTLATGPAD